MIISIIDLIISVREKKTEILSVIIDIEYTNT